MPTSGLALLCSHTCLFMTKLTNIRRPALVHITDEQPGYRRKKWGRGFAYLDLQGEHIRDKIERDRIRSLAIPPAWRDVWICPNNKGYLQATGRDERGRKQYIYHAAWTQYRQAQKFRHVESFALSLPTIRHKVEQHLQHGSWTKEKVLALVVSVLDETGMRIGNKIYKEKNDTYGLTTMRRKHLVQGKHRLLFSYRGKSGQEQEVGIEDPRLIRLIRECSELPGYEVFRYQDDEGRLHNVESQDVNEYLQSICHGDFSSKDFRTWTATVAAVEIFSQMIQHTAEPGAKPEKISLPEVVREVAKRIGNTPAVCREYYIHPRVLNAISTKEIPNYKSVYQHFTPKYIQSMDEDEIITLAIIHKAAGPV